MANKPPKAVREIVRANRALRFIRLGRTKVAEYAQRKLNHARVDHLANNMDIDQLGTPEVSERAGYFFIMDGQHRIEALKLWLGKGWEDQELQCWVATGLTEQEEAEIFLRMNDTLVVGTFEKFRIARRAGRKEEVEIGEIVEREGLNICQQSQPGAVHCVGTLKTVFVRDGGAGLSRTLALARDSFGDSGMAASVIDGLGLLCHRYNGTLDETSAAKSLNKAHGGVSGLLGSAEQLRQKTGSPKGHCVAAAAVEIINRDLKVGKKLASWWKN